MRTPMGWDWVVPRVDLLLSGKGLSARLGAPTSTAWVHRDSGCWAATTRTQPALAQTLPEATGPVAPEAEGSLKRWGSPSVSSSP